MRLTIRLKGYCLALAVVQPNRHFHTGLEKTGAGKEPHPHSSQRGHSITAVGRTTGFLQVHETSSVHCESEIILFIQQQWNLNKNNCTHTRATGKHTKSLPCTSLGIGEGVVTFFLSYEFSKFPRVGMYDS